MTPADTYLEVIAEAATPVEIVGHVYRYTLDQVRHARRHLAKGAIAERSEAVCRAIDGLGQLLLALDHQHGGDLSTQLEDLYHYIRRRLTEGNTEQRDEPLAEAERLLSILQEGWEGVMADTLRTRQYPTIPDGLPDGPIDSQPRAWVL